jgi:AcrR family transcriptional regulator
MSKTIKSERKPEPRDESEARKRILEAAFTAFMNSGYTAASTLEIASLARVSKRELYALVGNKREMLVACITARASRFQVPADLPMPRDRETLAHVLTAFGTKIIHEVSDPTVIAAFRLAIAEATHAPEVAQVLDSIGREAGRVALRKVMTQASDCGVIKGRPPELAGQFAGLLWHDLLVSLLLGVAERPNPHEIAARARNATIAFLQLHVSAG